MKCQKKITSNSGWVYRMTDLTSLGPSVGNIWNILQKKMDFIISFLEYTRNTFWGRTWMMWMDGNKWDWLRWIGSVFLLLLSHFSCSCLTLCDRIDSSPPGSPIPVLGMFFFELPIKQFLVSTLKKWAPYSSQRRSESSNKPCVHKDPETPQKLRQNCVWVSPGGTGQQWSVAGAGALGAADLGKKAFLSDQHK